MIIKPIRCILAYCLTKTGAPPAQNGTNVMSKNSRSAAAAVAAAATENNSQGTAQAENTTPAPVMQVLKPEPEQPAKPEQPKPLSISEIKKKAQEMHYLSEQHDNLMQQLEKVQQFAAEVGEDATLRLSSNGVHSFTSKDPAAVAQMVDICIRNIKGRIEEVETKLAA